MEDSRIEIIETTVKELKKDVEGIRDVISSANCTLEQDSTCLSRISIDLADLRTKMEGVQKVSRKESRREKRNREAQLTVALVSLVLASFLGSLALGNPAYRALGPYSPTVGLIVAGLLYAGGVYLIFWGGRSLLHYVESAR